MRAFQLTLTTAGTNYNLRSLVEATLAGTATVAFSGSGLNDVTLSVPGTKTRSIVVTVSLAAATDKFNLDVDGFRVLTNQNMAATVVYDGTTIAFAATTGHTLGDKWSFDVQGPPIVNMWCNEIVTQSDPGNGGAKVLRGDLKLTSSNYGRKLSTGDVDVLNSAINNIHAGDIYFQT